MILKRYKLINMAYGNVHVHNNNIPVTSTTAGFELPILLVAVTIIVTLVTLVV